MTKKREERGKLGEQWHQDVEDDGGEWWRTMERERERRKKIIDLKDFSNLT